MNAETILRRLQEAPEQQLPLSALKTDEAFQPRDLRMVPYRQKSGVEGRSEEMIGRMRLHLEAAHTAALEAVLVASIGGDLLVVDGHHRLKAYQLASRTTIPVRIHRMSRKQAVLASKLANCTERALPMHAQQCRDAAWQYLAMVTSRGRRPLPKGESLRKVAGRFGIAKDTAMRMLKKLPKVESDWPEAARDPGTGFVRWRYVGGSAGHWKDLENNMTIEQRNTYRTDKAMKKIGGMIESESPEVRRLIWMGLIHEAREELASDPDADAFIAETEELPSEF